MDAMPVDIDLTLPSPRFNPEKWIGCGKVDNNLPTAVVNAKAAALTPPDNFLKQLSLPPPSCPTQMFVQTRLLHVSAQFSLHAAALSFSPDQPSSTNINDVVAILMSRSAPREMFLVSLEEAVGQAWLDGKKSVVDQRYSDGRDRLPLWVLRFWRIVVDHQKAQNEWEQGLAWLERAEVPVKSTDKQRKRSEQEKKEADLYLHTLGWNEDLPEPYATLSTLQLAKYLGTGWLSDDHIDMMVRVLQERQRERALATESATSNLSVKTILANLSFGRLMRKYEDTAKPRVMDDKERWSRSKALYRYEEEIKAGTIDRILFPLHINDDHWIPVEISFRNKAFCFGDSAKKMSSTGVGPHRFIVALQNWLVSAFGKKFSNHGNTLQHTFHNDGYSCGPIAINTLEHAVFGTPLWTPEDGPRIRLHWFNTFAKIHKKRQTDLASETTSAIPASVPIPTQSEVPRIPISSLLSPAPTVQSSAIASAKVSVPIASLLCASDEWPEYHSTVSSASNMTDAPLLAPDASDPDSATGTRRDRDVLSISSLLNEIQSIQKEEDGTAQLTSGEKDARINYHYLSDESCEYDSWMESDAEEDRTSEDEPAPKRPKVSNGEGKSRSVDHGRKVVAGLQSGSIGVDTTKFEGYKAKIIAIDPGATFVTTGQPSVYTKQAVHSLCQKTIIAKVPYNTSRFRDHVKTCMPLSTRSHSLLSFGVVVRSHTLASSSTIGKHGRNDTPSVPCPGLLSAEYPKVANYLLRASSSGGGGRSLFIIGNERFKKSWVELTVFEKQVVRDLQRDGRKWENDHYVGRIHSTQCQKVVTVHSGGRLPLPCPECKKLFKDKGFRNAIARNIPSKTAKYVPHTFLKPQLAEIYNRTKGVQDLVESATSSKINPFVRFAQGVLKGKYENNEVLYGLLHAVFAQEDRKTNDKGMQGYRYQESWARLCDFVRVQSPRVYKSLHNYIPMPNIETLKRKERRLPRFPFTINDPRCFELAAQSLSALGYMGPVSLSCDDTKLHPRYALWLDLESKIYYMIGGTGGPIQIPEPEHVAQVIEQEKTNLAVKVRVWCLTIPIPGIAPIVVAAMPISDSCNANTLLEMHMKIIAGLRSKDVAVISYATDGASVERQVQKAFMETGTEQKHPIANPYNESEPIPVTFSLMGGKPVTTLQDGKHCLKTGRNNGLSGARLLVAGNDTISYSKIHDIAVAPNSPLHLRDVVKLDRQDDNAATRLFSASTLDFTKTHFPQNLALIAYLFIFGELIDAFQNRSIDHSERTLMVLRAYFFFKTWSRYLALTGHAKAQHFISHQAEDIISILINGYLSLLIIHRDYWPNIPFLPWLHSTETCEHIFGEARQVVEDFTFLDFVYMMPRLRLKIHEVVMRGKTANGRDRASGYSHTYFDRDGVNFIALTTFPTNERIDEIAKCAARESSSIWAMLGVDAGLAWSRVQQLPAYRLPSISHIADHLEVRGPNDSDSEGEEVAEEPGLKSTTSGAISAVDAEDQIRAAEDVSHPHVQILQSAALSLAISCHKDIEAFVDESTSEDADHVYAAEYALIQDIMTPTTKPGIQSAEPFVSLRPINNHIASSSRPLGQGSLTLTTVDVDELVALRRLHETAQARKGVRQKVSPHRSLPGASGSATPTVQVGVELAKQFHTALRYANADTERGKARLQRWGVTSGNAVNAAAAAANHATKASSILSDLNPPQAIRRQQIFTTAKVPQLSHLMSATVSPFQPITRGSWGFVMTPDGVKLGVVVALYSKTGGAKGKHAAIEEHSNIAAVSNLGVQTFRYIFDCEFRPVTDRTFSFLTNEYTLIPSSHFLTLCEQKKRQLTIDISHPVSTMVHLSTLDVMRYKSLVTGEDSLVRAMSQFSTRKKKDAMGDEEE